MAGNDSKSRLMKCGCVAQAVMKRKDGKELKEPIPVCVIHDCKELAEDIPDLRGRTARCSYFGRVKPRQRFANDECNYGCKGEPKCRCSQVPSSFDLAFFKHKPDSDHDEFYCGCFGWD